MADNFGPVKPLPDERESLDFLQFWELHRAKILGGVVGALLVVVIFMFWRMSAESAANQAEMAFANARSFADYQQVIVNYPKSAAAARALLLLADNRFKMQRYDEALSDYREFLGRYPKHPLAEAAMYGLAASLESKGQIEDAIQAYNQYMAEYPAGFQVSDAQLAIGRCQEALGKLEEARRTYENLVVATRPTLGMQPSPIYTDAQDRLAVVKRKLRAASGEKLPVPENIGTATPVPQEAPPAEAPMTP